MQPLNIFIGYDHRQALASTVLMHSIVERASVPVCIRPLVLPTLPLKRMGLTPFTYSRFLVPHLMGHEGWALFLDADELVFGDIADLFALADPTKAVMVHKHPVHQFEWASVMLFNCGHPSNRILIPDYVQQVQNPFAFPWLGGPLSRDLGDLPAEWNFLVGYDEPGSAAWPMARLQKVRLAHFTQGIPAHAEVRDLPFAFEWGHACKRALHTESWSTLMGQSVHAFPVRERLARRRGPVAAPAVASPQTEG